MNETFVIAWGRTREQAKWSARKSLKAQGRKARLGRVTLVPTENWEKVKAFHIELVSPKG